MHALNEWLSTLLSPGSGLLSDFGRGLAAVLLAYAGGVLSSLTPCIYPMIPITVSVIGGTPIRREAAQDTKGRWKQMLSRSLAYVGGMTLVYSILGVVAGLTGRMFGSLTNRPGWYLGLGLFMTVFALVMLDIIPFDPATWWERAKGLFSRRNSSGAAFTTADKGKTTVFGALVLGATSGSIAAPCTTPILASILAYIANTQSVFFGLALMIAFSLGLSTLLLVVAGFAGAMRALPRSGNWMKAIKIVSGLILLVFAEYLMFRAGSLGGFQ